MSLNGGAAAVFFDLDGTLIDTAPDMIAVLQQMQKDLGDDPVDYDLGRSHVSNGSQGLVRLAFGELDDEPRLALQQDYLDRYSNKLCEETSLFPGLAEMLDEFDRHDRPWGVVTNKPAFLTEPLMSALGLKPRSSAIVSGDTLSVRKPDPGPLLHACDLAGVEPANTIYVGDAARDIEAGRSAGMATVGALYGYVTAEDDPDGWGADTLVRSSPELASLLIKAFNL
ncbi:MAG: HAD-IA family hydrolase [Woeseiaceae bacterium]|nr:HAD-IA family hydrolase [Woeseiaceae bacterium]